MKDKVFYSLLFVLLGTGILVTLSHLAYMLYAYPNSSIIYFVSKELWL